MRALSIAFSVLVPNVAFGGDLQLSPEQIEAGIPIYANKCASCHGRDASGASAPDIQGVLVKDVIMAAKGVEKMPKVEISQDDAEAVATYLMSLAPDQALKRLNNRR